MKNFSRFLVVLSLAVIGELKADNNNQNQWRRQRQYEKINGPVQAVTAPAIGTADAILGRPWLFGDQDGY